MAAAQIKECDTEQNLSNNATYQTQMPHSRKLVYLKKQKFTTKKNLTLNVENKTLS